MRNDTLELKLAIRLLLKDNSGRTLSRVATLVGKRVFFSCTLHKGECFLGTQRLGNVMVIVVERLIKFGSAVSRIVTSPDLC